MLEASSSQMQVELNHVSRMTGAPMWGKRRHLLDTDDLNQHEIECFLKMAALCKDERASAALAGALNRLTVANIFYENSTRTRSSFELAAHKLGANVLNLDTRTSSVSKGETIVDTTRQLVSMGVAAVVQRHNE